MHNDIKKTLTEVIAEAEKTLKANITLQDLQSISRIINNGYSTQRLLDIRDDTHLKRRVLDEKIVEVPIDKETVDLFKRALINDLKNPQAPISVTEGLTMQQSTKVFFRTDIIDGVCLLQSNAVAVYRKEIPAPTVIVCKTAEEAGILYDRLLNQINAG